MNRYIRVLIACFLTTCGKTGWADISSARAEFSKGERQKAFQEFMSLAESGNAEAEYEVGQLYVLGEGVSSNPSVGIDWIRKAAEGGLAKAQNDLGWEYAAGLSIKKDYAAAMKWFLKAAEQDDPFADFNLNEMYYHGFGVKKDSSKATAWFQKAADKGDMAAEDSLGYAYETGTGVKRDPKQIMAWYSKAAEQGSLHAQYNLGDIYRGGINRFGRWGVIIPKDPYKAYYWLSLVIQNYSWITSRVGSRTMEALKLNVDLFGLSHKLQRLSRELNEDQRQHIEQEIALWHKKTCLPSLKNLVDQAPLPSSYTRFTRRWYEATDNQGLRFEEVKFDETCNSVSN